LNGGDAVIFYLLEWDQGKNIWTALNSYTTDMTIPTSYQHNVGYVLPSGGTINYRLTAKNGVGYGKISTITPVTCDSVPLACNAP
jgi:hypothetical protein